MFNNADKHTFLNSIVIEGKIYSIKEFKDVNNENYCILRLKVTNTHKGRITDVNLLDCYAYKKCYETIINEYAKNDIIRVTGKIQKRNTKDWTLKVFKIN